MRVYGLVFPVSESHVGYIDGFVRRMWQGNETHRGRKGRPGRVATLIPKSNKRTYGKAFVLKSKEQVQYLELGLNYTLFSLKKRVNMNV